MSKLWTREAAIEHVARLGQSLRNLPPEKKRQAGKTYEDMRAAAEGRAARFVERIRAGDTLQAIANDEGITRERVRQIVYKATGEGRLRMKFFRERMREYSLAHPGTSIMTFAKALDTHYSVVQKFLKDEGLTERHKRIPLTVEQKRAKRLQYRNRWKSRLDLTKIPHGTSTAYTNWGCRCDQCKKAVRTPAVRESIKRAKENAKLRGCPENRHGTLTGYSYWCCRCTKCRDAMRTRWSRRARQERHDLLLGFDVPK